MLIFSLLVGGFLVLLGFLVKSNPNLIAGYNTMSDEEKKNVDVEGLSSAMRNYLIFMGVFLVVFYLVFHWIGWEAVAQQAIFVSVLGTTPFLILHAQKFNRNKGGRTKSWFAFSFIIVVVAVVLSFIYYWAMSPQVKLNGKELSISGAYGSSWEVRSVELIESIPPIEMKTDGFNLGETLKGDFRLEKWGTCKLFIESKSGPFILVTTSSGLKIIINQKTGTEELARQLTTEM